MAKSIDLPVNFCAPDVLDIANDFRSILDGRRKNVDIDMSNVERVDTLAVQLLVSLQISCMDKGGDLTLKNITENVEDIMVLLGLSVLFE